MTGIGNPPPGGQIFTTPGQVSFDQADGQLTIEAPGGAKQTINVAAGSTVDIIAPSTPGGETVVMILNPSTGNQPPPPPPSGSGTSTVNDADNSVKGNPLLMGTEGVVGIFISNIEANQAQKLAALEEIQFKLEFIKGFTEAVSAMADLQHKEGETEKEQKFIDGGLQMAGGLAQGFMGGIGVYKGWSSATQQALGSTASGLTSGATSFVDGVYAGKLADIKAKETELQNMMQLVEKSIDTAQSNADKLNSTAQQILDALKQLLSQMRHAFNTLSAQSQG